jgi:hypothetical protein
VREVTLVLRSSGFFLRLRVQFRAMLPVFVGAIAAGFLLPAMLLCLLMLNDSPELFGFGHGQLFAILATANVGFFVALVLLAIFVRSLVPSAAERYLPRAVTFRVDGLRVEPQAGNAYEVSWTWISKAVRTTHGIDLEIAHTPTFTLHVTPAMVGENHFEQLLNWLAHHQKY